MNQWIQMGEEQHRKIKKEESERLAKLREN